MKTFSITPRMPQLVFESTLKGTVQYGRNSLAERAGGFPITEGYAQFQEGILQQDWLSCLVCLASVCPLQSCC